MQRPPRPAACLKDIAAAAAATAAAAAVPVTPPPVPVPEHSSAACNQFPLCNCAPGRCHTGSCFRNKAVDATPSAGVAPTPGMLMLI